MVYRVNLEDDTFGDFVNGMDSNAEYMEDNLPKNNLAGTTDPVANNDSTQDYSQGSLWINTVNKSAFVCTDATVGAAVWEPYTGVSGVKSARFVIGTIASNWTAKDCDYLCDGEDDQEEINNAINALPATGGEIVILDGTYDITAKINVNKNNVSIRGNGNATILKRGWNSVTSEGVITLTSVEGCRVENLQIDGNKAVYTSYDNYGIRLDSSSNNTVTGNTCNNNYYYGIRLDSSSNNTVTGNICNNNNSGIYLHLSSNNTVTGNTCNNNYYWGICLSSSSNNTVTGNTCNNNSYGIYLSSSDNNTVTGNTCNNNFSYGIYLSSSDNNTVTGNTCNNNDSGIYLESSNNENTITGNTCIRGEGQTSDYVAGQYTIRLSGTGNNYNLISSNNCMGKAVVVGGGTGNSVYGNKYDETHDFPDFPDFPIGVRAQRLVVGTTRSGWTKDDCDYLCDGTDDQVKINAAIQALPSDDGGEIVILDGTYNITAKINVNKNNVSIRGNGNATILKKEWNSLPDEGVITLTSVEGCRVENLQIDGNRDNYTSENGIYLYSSDNNTITGNTCNYNSDYGIRLNLSSNNTITGNTCNYNSECGIYLDSSNNENTITGNTCNDNYDGIYLESSSNNTITGNICKNNYEGIYLSSSDNNNVTGNTSNNNSYSIYLESSSNNNVTSNTCNDNYYEGIYLESFSNNNTVTGNTCNNNDEGIYLESSSNNTITGNTCNDNNYDGIYSESSSNNTITGNICICGEGQTSDYTGNQYTIRLSGTDNDYNLISLNNCMGKAVVVGGGTGNSVFNNKYDESSDFETHLSKEASQTNLGHVKVDGETISIDENGTISTGAVTEETFIGRVGDVDDTPTANTILGRLKEIEDKLDAIKDTDGIKKITDGVALTGSRVEEVLTQADAVENILTFSDAISSIEIWHNETTPQIFVVNGITLVIGPGGWRSPVAGVESAEVTIPAGIDCVVTRLV